MLIERVGSRGTLSIYHNGHKSFDLAQYLLVPDMHAKLHKRLIMHSALELVITNMWVATIINQKISSLETLVTKIVVDLRAKGF